MPRFVLLRHETPAGFGRPSHWDLMLQTGDHLRCWALAQLPDDSADQWAEGLADHRLAYLEYEGPVSRDRGHVARQDEGKYDMLIDTENEVIVQLRGTRLRGTLTLRRDAANESRWRVLYKPLESRL